ncbi:MAG: hypothetical protein ACE5K4_00230 [Candidatus Hydrothermarchaeota archaeon]
MDYVIDKRTGKPIEVKVKWASWEDKRYLINSERWKKSVFGGWRGIVNDGYNIRVLTHKETGEVLGAYAFSIHKEKGYLFIDYIESIVKDEIKYIGTTLMKDAVKQAFQCGFKGRVRLISRWTKEETQAPEKFFLKIGMEKEVGNIHCLDANIHYWNFSFDEESAKKFLEKCDELLSNKNN